PGTVDRPAALTVVDGLPATEPFGQVPPDGAGAFAKQDSTDHRPVVLPFAAPGRISWQQRPQKFPLSVGELKTPCRSHSDGITRSRASRSPHPPPPDMIHQTRPSGDD